MRAFLLAAGRGTRINKDIPNIPKCTLDVGGVPLIVNTINLLHKNGVDVTVITGYEHLYLENILKEHDVNVVYNPFYDITNSIGSLWMAREQLSPYSKQIIANADVYWDQTIFDSLMSVKENAVMLADKTRVDNGDYFFRTENGILRAYGKELKRDERDCEYVGIATIKGEMAGRFIDSLKYLVATQNHGLWWENALYELSEKKPIYVADVNGAFWSEIDTIDDYNRILEHVRNQDK